MTIAATRGVLAGCVRLPIAPSYGSGCRAGTRSRRTTRSRTPRTVPRGRSVDGRLEDCSTVNSVLISTPSLEGPERAPLAHPERSPFPHTEFSPAETITVGPDNDAQGRYTRALLTRSVCPMAFRVRSGSGNLVQVSSHAGSTSLAMRPEPSDDLGHRP